MKNSGRKIRIKIGNNKVVTLHEFFSRKERARRRLAGLPFEEKLQIVQNLARFYESTRPFRETHKSR